MRFRLSCNREALDRLSESDARYAVLERRMVIRSHRDQLGDDRCFMDDYGVWAALEDSPIQPTWPFIEYVGMILCRRFYEHRRRDAAPVIPPDALQNRRDWDADLIGLDSYGLANILLGLQIAIRTHRDIGSGFRTWRDDEALYAVLPERIPADFRLPPEPEFLGFIKAPRAGCPSFWRSHATCPTRRHALDHWGPCPLRRP